MKILGIVFLLICIALGYTNYAHVQGGATLALYKVQLAYFMNIAAIACGIICILITPTNSEQIEDPVRKFFELITLYGVLFYFGIYIDDAKNQFYVVTALGIMVIKAGVVIALGEANDDPVFRERDWPELLASIIIIFPGFLFTATSTMVMNSYSYLAYHLFLFCCNKWFEKERLKKSNEKLFGNHRRFQKERVQDVDDSYVDVEATELTPAEQAYVDKRLVEIERRLAGPSRY